MWSSMEAPLSGSKLIVVHKINFKVFALLQPIDLLTLYDNDAILLEFGSPTDFGGLLRRSSRGSLTRRESLALQKAKASPASNVLAARLFLGGVAATVAPLIS